MGNGPCADPLLTAREGAAELQVSVPAFWRRAANGTLPKIVKLGGMSRWPRSELLAMIERAKTKRDAAWKETATRRAAALFGMQLECPEQSAPCPFIQ